MAHINDLKYQFFSTALGKSGNLNDLMVEWFSTELGMGGSLNALEFSYYYLNTSNPSSNLNELKYNFLVEQVGHTGNINDLEKEFYENGGFPTSNIIYGADENFDGGTVGDWYVDVINGSDTNSGTSVGDAFATIQKAVDSASSGEKILVLAGTYREKVSFAGTTFLSTVTLSRYSTDEVIVSGADIITGWVQCTIADEPVVGPNYANIYKKNIAAVDVPAQHPSAFNLREAGNYMQIATDRLSNNEPFFQRNPEEWHLADANFGVDGSNNVISIQDASVFPNYTSAQLVKAGVYFFGSPNYTYHADITAYDNVNTITIDNSTAKLQTGATYSNRYSLINILPAMTVGGWGYFVEGDSSVTLYCWPTDTANLASNMEFSVRDGCIDLNNGDFISIEGIYAYQSAGDGGAIGAAIGTIGSAITTPRKTNITIKNCKAGKVAFKQGGYGGIYQGTTDNISVESVTIEEVYNGWGMFWQRTDNAELKYAYITYAENSPIRLFGGGPGNISDTVMFNFSKFKTCGRDTHSNKGNAYEQCQNVLLYGVICDDVYGYLTWQEADGIYIGFCEIPASDRSASSGEGRAIVDQSNSTTEPDPSGTITIWNTWTKPNPKNLADGGAWQLGSNQNTMTTSWYNCNYSGGGRAAGVDAARFGDQKNNLIAIDSTNTDVTDLFTTDLDDIYVDAANGNFNFKNGGLAGMAGYDMTSILATIAAIFPNADLTKDADGKTIDWGSPFIGCRNPNFVYPQAIPDAFTAGQWDLTNPDTDGELTVTINSLPANNNSNIYDIEYRVNGGSPVSTGGTGSFTIGGLTNGVSVNVEIRAINGLGPTNPTVNWSDIKAETPTLGAYSANAVVFETGTDWAYDQSTWGATGGTKKAMFSFWVYCDNAAWQSTGVIFRISNAAGGSRIDAVLSSSGRLNCIFRDSAGTNIANVNAATNTFTGQTWYHVIVSVDTAQALSSDAIRMFVNGSEVSYSSQSHTQDALIDTDLNRCFLFTGSSGGSSQPAANHYFADFFIDTAESFDLTIPSNLAKFIDGSGKPVNLGSDGSTPLGSAPDLFLSGATGTWHINKGALGGLTLNGTLSTAPSSPSD